jgi:hypothetical protein
MLIDRRMPCLGFTILRFAFHHRPRSPERLREVIALFAEEESSDQGFIAMLIDAMVFVEVEKILRILHRVRTTGQYVGFLNNICPVHVANLTLLRNGFLHE